MFDPFSCEEFSKLVGLLSQADIQLVPAAAFGVLDEVRGRAGVGEFR